MTSAIIGRGWAFPPRVDRQGVIALTNEKSEIEQALRIILETAPGERVMRPTFGCRLHELMFAPCNAQTFAQARRHVEDAIGQWEPRIDLLQVDVQRDDDQEKDGRLLIDIHYRIRATHDQRNLVFPFYLIPGE